MYRPLTPPLDVKFQEWRGLIKSHPPFLERENRICLADSDAPRPPDPTVRATAVKDDEACFRKGICFLTRAGLVLADGLNTDMLHADV